MNADRNLLLAILALQNNFIDRHQLITAFDRWLADKSLSLGYLLQQYCGLAAEEHALLDALVSRHLERHDNDPEKSLADLSPIGSWRYGFSGFGDPTIDALFADALATNGNKDEPYPTRTWTAGQWSSVGLRFRVLRPHARGGLGKVYVACDEELHREVALKEIQSRHADNPDSRARFLLEAEITGGLEHPGIVPVYGLGTYADGRPFYAMRFIKGETLKEAIERFHKPDGIRDPGERALELRKLLGRLVEVCNAIEYAHSRGVLHRDLKPGNVMLGKYGETLVVDWGLAKVIGRPETKRNGDERTLQPSSASSSTPTQLGSAVGTPQYMSPEQAEGRLSDLRPASDVYSLGATLYSLLTGRPPFDETDLTTILARVGKGDFPRPREVFSGIPRTLEAVCLKAMAVVPEDRYQSPRALADDIEHWLGDEPVSALPNPLAERLARWGRRHRPWVQAAVVGMVVITVGTTLSTFFVQRARQHEREQRDRANREAIMASKAQKVAENATKKSEAAQRETEDALRKATAAQKATNTALREAEKSLHAARQMLATMLHQDGANPEEVLDCTATVLQLIDQESLTGEAAEAVFFEIVSPALRLVELHFPLSNANAEMRKAAAVLYAAKGRLVSTQYSLLQQGQQPAQEAYAAFDLAARYDPDHANYYVERGFARWSMSEEAPHLAELEREDLAPLFDGKHGVPPAEAYGLRGKMELAEAQRASGTVQVDLYRRAIEDFEKAIHGSEQQSSRQVSAFRGIGKAEAAHHLGDDFLELLARLDTVGEEAVEGAGRRLGKYTSEFLDSLGAAYVEMANCTNEGREVQRIYVNRAVELAERSKSIAFRPHPEHAWLNSGNALECFAWLLGDNNGDHYCRAIVAFERAAAEANAALSSPALPMLCQGRCRYKLLAAGRSCGRAPQAEAEIALRNLQEALNAGADDPHRALPDRSRREALYWQAQLRALAANDKSGIKNASIEQAIETSERQGSTE